jgi:hypothetical protein
MSHQQKCHGFSHGEGGRVYCDGLAWEFADLNPIENVWAHMKLKLKSKKLKNLQELKTAITTMWVDDMHV